MKSKDEIEILAVDVENSDLQMMFKKKEFETHLLSSFNLKWHQKVYIKIYAKINGLFSGLWKYKRH